MVQAKGILPLDSRLRVDREGSTKYSTSARSRTRGLSAARRAMPTNRAAGAGGVGTTATDLIAKLKIKDKGSFAFYSPIVKQFVMGFFAGRVNLLL